MISFCFRVLLGVALLCSFAGCGALTSRPAERTEFTVPQTGSNIGRRVAARSSARQQQARTQEREKKRKRPAAKPAREKKAKREMVDEDFTPRGGFR